MSGGNCPETPRQKMIGMMYLFLTAMLAVNVSSTVLNGFTLVDESLRTNNEIFAGNNDAIYGALKFQYDNNKTKFGPAYNKSLEIKQKSNELYALIDTGKWMVARACDGEFGDPYHIQAKDNVDAGFQALIFKIVGSKEPTYASLIKEGINDFRDFLLTDVDEKTAASIKKCLDTSDPVPLEGAHGGHGDVEKNISWEETMFTGIPVGAVMALMTKMQADIRNTESMALTQLVSKVTADDLKVNKIQAHIIPFKSYIVRGATFKAHALLAATDSTQTPSYELFVNGNPVKPINDQGEYEIPCTSTGVFEVTGSIISKDDKGNDNPYPFDKITYEVADPFATVSATKMNVLYAGVDNPMSISVPGFSSKDIKPVLSDGSPLIAKDGGYIAKPKKAGKDIDVIVKADIEGVSTLVGKYTFRVKSLPPPTAYIQYPKTTTDASGKAMTMKEKFASGYIKKSDLLNAYGVVAELPDSDFEVKYDIQSFDITFYDTMGNAKIFTSTSSKFTGDQIKKIKGLTKGKQFYISNVRAIGPDGVSRRLSAIDVFIN